LLRRGLASFPAAFEEHTVTTSRSNAPFGIAHSKEMGSDVSVTRRTLMSAGRVVVKDRVNAISLAPTEDFRRDSDLFGEGVGNAEAQKQLEAAFRRGFQSREAEMSLGRLLGELADDR